MGVLLSYVDACTDGASGVAVTIDGTSLRPLLRDSTGRDRWATSVVYANGDGFPDIRTQSRLTGAVDYFIYANDTFIHAPQANGDSVAVPDAKKTTIPVLANDYVTGQAKVTITTPPRYGHAQVGSDRKIYYTPDPAHGRTDKLVYTVTEVGGRKSTTSVYLRFAE
jgi:hypothetical protein